MDSRSPWPWLRALVTRSASSPQVTESAQIEVAVQDPPDGVANQADQHRAERNPQGCGPSEGDEQEPAK